MFLPKGFGGEAGDSRQAQLTDIDDIMRESAAAERFCLGNCSVHPQINIKFQKVNWAVMSNNKP
jgi:hypothetical protein